MTEVKQITTLKKNRQANAKLLDRRTYARWKYASMEIQYKKMFENPERYDLCDIIKFNRR